MLHITRLETGEPAACRRRRPGGPRRPSSGCCPTVPHIPDLAPASHSWTHKHAQRCLGPGFLCALPSASRGITRLSPGTHAALSRRQALAAPAASGSTQRPRPLPTLPGLRPPSLGERGGPAAHPMTQRTCRRRRSLGLLKDAPAPPPSPPHPAPGGFCSAALWPWGHLGTPCGSAAARVPHSRASQARAGRTGWEYQQEWSSRLHSAGRHAPRPRRLTPPGTAQAPWLTCLLKDLHTRPRGADTAQRRTQYVFSCGCSTLRSPLPACPGEDARRPHPSAYVGTGA